MKPEIKQLRERWIFEDPSQDYVYDTYPDIWDAGEVPDNFYKVREVSAEYDAAVEALLKAIEFLDSQELLDKICGSRLLRALRRFDDAAKGLK